GDPLAAEARPQPSVEPDGRAIPVEHRPLEPPAAAADRDARERGEQRPPGSLPALLGQHEEIFQIERGPGEEGEEREEVEGESHGPPPPGRGQGPRAGRPPAAPRAW